MVRKTCTKIPAEALTPVLSRSEVATSQCRSAFRPLRVEGIQLQLTKSVQKISHLYPIVWGGWAKEVEIIGKVGWEGARGLACSATLKKRDTARTTSESHDRRALSIRCDITSAWTYLGAAAAALQLKRVFSAISAPFGLNASDSCYPHDSSAKCGTSTSHLT